MVVDNHLQDPSSEGQIRAIQAVSQTLYYPEQGDQFFESGHTLAQRTRPPVDNEMISSIGINGLLLGFLTVFAGLFQVFGIPAICNDYVISATLKADNLYGFAIWCGAFNIISSTTALRVTISKRQSTLHRYIFCHAITMAVYAAAATVTIQTFTALPYKTLNGCDGLGQGVGVGLIFSGMIHSVVSLFFINTTIQERMRACINCCLGVLRRDSRQSDCFTMSNTRRSQDDEGSINRGDTRYDTLD